MTGESGPGAQWQEHGLPVWRAVDDYFAHALVPSDPALELALEAGRAAGLPIEGSISPSQGRFLELLVRMQQAVRVLEIGTLAGYSTIWLARGLAPGGRILTLERDAQRAAVARSTFERAELSETVEVRTGPAAGTLRLLVEQHARFDFVFIDADKRYNPLYFHRAVQLSRPGTVIVVDNVVRKGAVLDTDSQDPNVQGVRRLVQAVANERRVEAAVVQTVSSKRYDGFALLRVRTDSDTD